MKKMLSFLCASVICLSGSSMYVYAEGTDTPADDPVIQEYVYTQSISSALSILIIRNNRINYFKPC